MLFTFGKYAGYKVSEVKSTTYLVYALLNFPQIDPLLREELKMEIAQRLSIDYAHAGEDTSPQGVVDKQTILNTFKTLFIAYQQPEKNNPLAQKALREFRDELLALTPE